MKKSTIAFIVLSGFASFCNYAIYPALSRVLAPGEFIDITVALTLFTQLSSFMLAVVALTIGITKRSNGAVTRRTLEKLQTILAHMFVLIIGGFLLLSPFILDGLRLPIILLAPICLMLGLSLIMSVLSGYLNGRQELTKLGYILAGSALLQFIACVAVGVITKNGVLALGAMAGAALLSVITVYVLCQNDNLPSLSSIFVHKLDIYKKGSDRALLIYTIVASLAALAINVLLVLDLLVVTNRGVDSILYTDIYVISRIVFFGGMLFVWPFLSSLELTNRRSSITRFILLTGVFILISIGAMLIMYFYGQDTLKILLGSNYTDPRLSDVAILSIIYKLIYLLLITLCLVFMVFRSYWAVTVPLVICVLVLVLMTVADASWTTESIISWLSVISGGGLILGLIGLWDVTTHSNRFSHQ